MQVTYGGGCKSNVVARKISHRIMLSWTHVVKKGLEIQAAKGVQGGGRRGGVPRCHACLTGAHSRDAAPV